MARRERIGIGLIGAGFLGETRARCYSRVSGVDAKILAVAALTTREASDFANRHGIPKWSSDFHEILSLPEVDMVDLCVPNHLHRPVTEAAARAGKHIVCTKPLTAYTGQDLPSSATDEEVGAQDRHRMLEVATRDAEAMVAAAREAGVNLMYGENWIYSPSVQKATELLLASGGTILEMRGGECHSGSHSPFSKLWRYTGGGALLRLGAHPIGTMIFLKNQEGLARNGKPIRPVSVTAEVGDLSRIESAEKSWIAKGWKDVENWGAAIVTFDDGSRGLAYGSDTVLGGMESRIEIFSSNCHFKCNLSPNDLLQAYAPDPAIFKERYVMEKLETKGGWSTPIPNEDWTSGHLSMCQEFVEAVAEGRPSPTDGLLGLEVVRTVYGAYCAAAQGQRVTLQVDGG